MALKKIGPYEFLGILGRGGMGSVYRGRNTETGETDAVKVLAHHFSDEEHFRSRFESEIRSLIKLDHPNIVRILSYGQEQGNLYFAMELVEGNSLFQMQKKGHRFDWGEILDIAKAVCKGLRHAHDRGIIHRDLKPGNLLMPIDEEGNLGEVKITDFGIAKRFGASQITGTNVLGTMDFMSPEQAKGQPVTFRSDLYSLGTVMFTLLSGKPPFSSNSVEESLRNLTKVPAPHVSSVVPDVPKELDRLIQKLMAKKPENRIQTAQALIYKIEELEEKLRESSQAQTRVSPLDDQDDNTFEVAQPGSDSTKANTRPESAKPSSGKAATSDARYKSKTVAYQDLDSDSELAPVSLAPPSNLAREIDYFNPVTDRIRQIETTIDEPEAKHRRGLVPILIALALVVGVAGFGVYQAYKPPSAEALFAEIESNVEKPHLALDEMEQFLRRYPDDERVAQVQELQSIGNAIQLYNGLLNRLSVRSNLPGESRLTEVEKQFLDIIEIADENKEVASIKMDAFITVHKNDPNLGQRDLDCLDAAEGYFIKLKSDARAEVLASLRKIRAAMEGAETAQSLPDQINLYQSILELYGDVEWGSSSEGREGKQLVARARNRLESAKKEQVNNQIDEQPDQEQEQ